MATLRKKNGKYFVDCRINGMRFRKTLGSSKKIAVPILKNISANLARNKLYHLKKTSRSSKKMFSEFLSSFEMPRVQEKNYSPDALKKAALYFEAIADPLIVTTPDGFIAKVNRGFSIVWKFSKREVIGRPISHLFAEESLQKQKKAIQSLLKTGQAQKLEMSALTKNGKNIPLIASVSAIKDPAGKFIGVLGVFKDIADLKIAEKAIKKERDMAELYFDTADVMMLALDSKKKVERINKKGCEILGYHKEDIIGKNWFNNFLPPRTRAKTKTVFTKLMSGNIKNVEYFENPIVAKNGEEKIIAWHNSILTDENGNITGTLSSGTDITEHKTFDAQIAGFQKSLIESNKKFREQALIDPLTGLYNHKYLLESVEAEFERAKRHGSSLSVIMIDVDYFRSINDVYGREFGDLVLKQFAVQLKNLFRKYDIVSRSGGEEFVVVSSATNKKTAMSLAERVLDKVNTVKFGDQKQTICLRLSVGVSSFPEDPASKGAQLIDRADKILGMAKNDGGNRAYDSLKKVSLVSSERDMEGQTVTSLANKLEKLIKRENQSSVEAILAFAKTIEVKDSYTKDHAEKTVCYALSIAKALSLPNDEVERIRQAALLHDLGKIGISESLLLKKSPLTEDEFREIKKHPVIAADILRPIRFFRDIIPLIYYHHEKWDGTGYPHGLKGEEIPQGARIIAVADVFQALSSDRPYRRAFSKEEALKIIKDESGTHFDPKIVAVFLDLFGGGEGGSSKS